MDEKDIDPLWVWNYAGSKGFKLKEDSSRAAVPSVEPQRLNVVAPQFSIDPKTINTFYPPPGHQDEAHVLPHIVFNDPHMPWLRYAGSEDPFHGPVDPDPTKDPLDEKKTVGYRNMVPWMALLVFDPEELRVPAENVPKGLGSISSYDPNKLPLDGAFPMKVGEYLEKIPTNRIYYEAGYTPKAFTELQESEEGTSIIFPTRRRLQEILGNKENLKKKLTDQKVFTLKHCLTYF